MAHQTGEGPIGSVEHIHVAEREGAQMLSRSEVRALPGIGLEGDRYASGAGRYSNDAKSGREVTLVEAEVLDALRAENGIELAPGATRRNVTTRGVRLNALVGRQFLIGDVLCEGTRLCEPCDYLAGLNGKPLVKPLTHKGGLRANILTEGVIRVGDEVRIAAAVAGASRDIADAIRAHGAGTGSTS